MVGPIVSSIMPPDLDHIDSVITIQKPDMIIALGRQSASACLKFHGIFPLLIAPHPASRSLTYSLYRMAG